MSDAIDPEMAGYLVAAAKPGDTRAAIVSRLAAMIAADSPAVRDPSAYVTLAEVYEAAAMRACLAEVPPTEIFFKVAIPIEAAMAALDEVYPLQPAREVLKLLLDVVREPFKLDARERAAADVAALEGALDPAEHANWCLEWSRRQHYRGRPSMKPT